MTRVRLAGVLAMAVLADERVPWRDGRWDVPLTATAARIPGIEVEGFFACPSGDETPSEDCH